MVASIDGSTVVDSNSTRTRPVRQIRRCCDAADLADVVDRRRRHCADRGLRPPKSPAAHRRGRRTGDIDADDALFTSGAGFLILPEDAPPAHGRTRFALVSARSTWRHVGATRRGFVQAEGGAGLNGALAAADLIDELNLTISPMLAGGDGPRVAGGAAATVAADAAGSRSRRRRLLVRPLLRCRRTVRCSAASSAARARVGNPRQHRSSCRRWRSAGR